MVWAHNSHIGDAALHRDGPWSASELNIGQLCREQYGDRRALIGFGTHTGTVAAAADWDEPMEVKTRAAVAARQLRAAVPRQRASPRFLLDLRDGDSSAAAAQRCWSRGWSASSA